MHGDSGWFQPFDDASACTTALLSRFGSLCADFKFSAAVLFIEPVDVNRCLPEHDDDDNKNNKEEEEEEEEAWSDDVCLE